jgi:diacylglycerol kinase family enzyme
VTARGLVLVNPASGPDDTDVDDLAGRFPEHDVEACEPGDIEARVEKAVGERRPFVAVAGGDGTIRCAAEVLAGTNIALLPIPAGTRNHFARELGVETLDDAVAAAKTGRTETIDLGRVNDTVFVNNSSIGLYPRLVMTRERDDHRLPKLIASFIAGYKQLRAGRRITVDVDGRALPAWLVFVGNGRYGETMTDLTTRESLHDGVLDVRIVRADQRFPWLRLVVAIVFGRLAGSPVMERRTCRAVTISVRHRAHVEVAVDGEVKVLSTPLRYESTPEALTVMVPANR